MVEGGIVLQKHPRRSAGLGFSFALVFLAFVSKACDNAGGSKRHGRNGINMGFEEDESVRQTVIGIVTRSCGAREVWTLLQFSLMLLLRTLGSVWVSRHWGEMVQSVVNVNFGNLRMQITEFAGMTILLTWLNSLLKYYKSSLRLQVREKITRWCHKKMMRPGDMVYYKANRIGDDRLENCDHQIASDVNCFSEVLVEVVSQSLKPTVDFLVYSVVLSRVQGILTPLTLYAWFAFASLLSNIAVPPFAQLAATEQRLEGQFRFRHSELIAHCEQIAFLRGHRPERRCLDNALDKLLEHCRRTISFSFRYELFRQYLNKYFVTVIGLLLISRPLRLKSARRDELPPTDEIAKYFTGTWRNMEAIASSIQELLDLSTRSATLGGLASRLACLMATLERQPEVLTRQIEVARSGPHPATIKDGDVLRFEHVTVLKPDGTVLVKDLNFSVERGQRVLVTGANGCGKSSLFRIICGLWPLVEGTITTPPPEDLHFIPQNTFVPVGTLRDLVTYPWSEEDVRIAGRTDKDVHMCLRWAHVSPRVVADGRAQLEFNDHGVIVRPQLDDMRDWQKELSPGQKQRIGFARLFFHKPSFVVLDECTNGVSPDVEHDLYDRCARLNMGVFSISHKNELKLFHDFELHYKGDIEGSWTISKCSEVRDEGKVVFSSALVRLPEPAADGKTESRITYERHIWFVE